MKNQRLKNLVNKSKIIESKKDFEIIILPNRIKGGIGGPARPKDELCIIGIEFNSICPINNTGCTGIEIE